MSLILNLAVYYYYLTDKVKHERGVAVGGVIVHISSFCFLMYNYGELVPMLDLESSP